MKTVHVNHRRFFTKRNTPYAYGDNRGRMQKNIAPLSQSSARHGIDVANIMTPSAQGKKMSNYL